MKCDEFLRELHTGLSGKLSESDITDILSDYSEIFTAGMEEGKTEEDVSKELGSPASIVKNIIDEQSPEHRSINSDRPENGMHIASLSRRFIAFAIDSVIALIPFFFLVAGPRSIVNAIFIAPVYPALPLFLYSGEASSPSSYTIAVNLLLLGFFWLYGTLALLLLKDKTIGMLVVGIKVVKSNGSRIKPLDILSRELLGKIIFPSISFGLSNAISFFWAVFSGQNNTIHDKLAGTIVVEDTRIKAR